MRYLHNLRQSGPPATGSAAVLLLQTVCLGNAAYGRDALLVGTDVSQVLNGSRQYPGHFARAMLSRHLTGMGVEEQHVPFGVLSQPLGATVILSFRSSRRVFAGSFEVSADLERIRAAKVEGVEPKVHEKETRAATMHDRAMPGHAPFHLRESKRLVEPNRGLQVFDPEAYAHRARIHSASSSRRHQPVSGVQFIEIEQIRVFRRPRTVVEVGRQRGDPPLHNGRLEEGKA